MGIVLELTEGTNSAVVLTEADPEIEILDNNIGAELVVTSNPADAIDVVIQSGPTGPQGPAGSPGDGGVDAYTHNQNTPANTWTVVHNLGERYLDVQVFSGGIELYPEVAYDSETTARILFPTPRTGVAKLAVSAPTSSNYVKSVNGIFGDVLVAGAGGTAPYIHNQASAGTTWTVTHNLGDQYPDVQVFVGGAEVFPDINYTSINETVIGFPSAVSGIAKFYSSNAPTVSTTDDDIYNVKYFGAMGDGTTDDTAAIQAALNAAGPLGAKVYFPDPSVRYKITAPLTIGAWHGLTITGESWETTLIRQATNNTQIFALTTDNTHSVTIEKLRLDYATTQTFASHPNSVAIARINSTGSNSTSGIYHLAFRDLKIENCTYGFGVVRTFGGDTTSTNPWWGCLWERILMTNVNRSAVNLNLGNIGAPCNTFRQFKVMLVSGTPNDGNAYCFVVRGEAIMEGIDVERWNNGVIDMSSGNYLTIRGLHIEHHIVTNNSGGNRLIFLANMPARIEGLLVSYDDTSGFNRHVIWHGGGAKVRVEEVTILAPPNGSVYLFSGSSPASSSTSYARLTLGSGVSAYQTGVGIETTVLSIDDQPSGVVYQPLKSGRYYFTNSPGTNATSAALGVGTIRVTPFWVSRACTIDRLFAEVVTAGDAGSLFRMGIYSSTADGEPGTLLVDGGTITGDTTGVKEVTVSAAVQPGLYWIAGVVQTVTTTQPTMRTASATASAMISVGSTTLPAANALVGGYQHNTTVSGALPSTFVVSSTLITTIPRIGIRVA